MVGKRPSTTYSQALGAPKITDDDPCGLELSVQLQRVQLDQLKGLKPGRPLAIRLEIKNNISSVICARLDNNNYLGSVAFSGIDALISCMKKGRRYEATINRIDGAAVQIEIVNIN